MYTIMKTIWTIFSFQHGSEIGLNIMDKDIFAAIFQVFFQT